MKVTGEASFFFFLNKFYIYLYNIYIYLFKCFFHFRKTFLFFCQLADGDQLPRGGPPRPKST